VDQKMIFAYIFDSKTEVAYRLFRSPISAAYFGRPFGPPTLSNVAKLACTVGGNIIRLLLPIISADFFRLQTGTFVYIQK